MGKLGHIFSLEKKKGFKKLGALAARSKMKSNVKT